MGDRGFAELLASGKKDAKRYLQGYPGEKDYPTHNKNLRFYRNEIPSQPEGDLIDKIHKKWFGKYELLERHHGYIQWLFPIRENGMNFESQKLQPHEAKAMRKDEACRQRLLSSYELMLDFYGMRLVDRATGQVSRSLNYKERYDNLNRNSHNYLRITRILKCLGELGFAHLQYGFLRHIFSELYPSPPSSSPSPDPAPPASPSSDPPSPGPRAKRELSEGVERSARCFWLQVLRDRPLRKQVEDAVDRRAKCGREPLALPPLPPLPLLPRKEGEGESKEAQEDGKEGEEEKKEGEPRKEGEAMDEDEAGDGDGDGDGAGEDDDDDDYPGMQDEEDAEEERKEKEEARRKEGEKKRNEKERKEGEEDDDQDYPGYHDSSEEEEEGEGEKGWLKQKCSVERQSRQKADQSQAAEPEEDDDEDHPGCHDDSDEEEEGKVKQQKIGV